MLGVRRARVLLDLSFADLPDVRGEDLNCSPPVWHGDQFLRIGGPCQFHVRFRGVQSIVVIRLSMTSNNVFLKSQNA